MRSVVLVFEKRYWNWINRSSCLPSDHSGRGVHRRALRRLSVRPSVRPALVADLQPTLFNGLYSYLVHPLTLVGAWYLPIMGSLYFILRILWHFEILQIQIDWCCGFWFVTTLQPTKFLASCSYLVRLLTLVGTWPLLIMGSPCLFYRVSNLLLELGRSRLLVPWTIFCPLV